jgi:NADH-quinone oxidoreductase subunit M
MIMVAFLLVLLIGSFMAWAAERIHRGAARWISLAALVCNFVLAVGFWGRNYRDAGLINKGVWLQEVNWDWIPALGIRFHLAIDGLSLALVILTFFLGLASVACSWTEIRERVGFFHFNILWILAGITGVFLSLDLFLFYFFWEVMLVPMYFLIGIWGHENRNYAALKFFIFTQAGSLLMLLSILGLCVLHHNDTSIWTFDYQSLLGTPMGAATAFWLMLGFFIAFAVKLPMVPFHPWLPDAHTEAPTAGSVILAGLLLKTGAYGMLRFAVPLFPGAAKQLAPVAIWLGVAGILYGAILAFGQTDLKRLVAYTSVSHLGFVLVGIYAWNGWALQGAVMQMICHGLSTGALFIVVGALQERIHTRDTRRMGGLWTVMPRMGGMVMFFALASLGLPGLGNFVGEFLVLLGAYRVNRSATVFGTIGLVAATIYALAIVQCAFHGENRGGWMPADLNLRDVTVLGFMVIALVWLGLYPQPVFSTVTPALEGLKQLVAM